MVPMAMDSPRYTVIVPMARFRPDEPVLVSLRDTPAPAGGVQVIVAEGVHPARQRNLAVARAQGEIVVFLDNDCSLGPTLLGGDRDRLRPAGG